MCSFDIYGYFFQLYTLNIYLISKFCSILVYQRGISGLKPFNTHVKHIFTVIQKVQRVPAVSCSTLTVFVEPLHPLYRQLVTFITMFVIPVKQLMLQRATITHKSTEIHKTTEINISITGFHQHMMALANVIKSESQISHENHEKEQHLTSLEIYIFAFHHLICSQTKEN